MLNVRAVAAAVVTGGVVLTGCTQTVPGPEPSPTPAVTTPGTSAEPTATAEPTPQSTPATALRSALVYFQTDAPAGARLVREPHQVTAAAPARGALEAMFAGPDDPDYASPWNPDTRVLGISDNAGVIIVDLSADARVANVGSEFAAMMQQQLIYTVTEQLGVDKEVLLHIDGRPAGDLWGAVAWATPQPRADWIDTLLYVGIDTPADGATVSSPVEITGQAAVFEANLPWRVLTPDGEVVDEGTAMTSAGMMLAPYRFEIDLAPGEYVIEITEDDPSGGEGGPLDVDTRRFTIN